MPVLVALGIIVVGLALPAFGKERTLRRLFLSILQSVFGVMLPLIFFFLSTFLLPEYKGACPHGWIDCFYLGKLALTPFVLWATAAFYVSEIYGVTAPEPAWIYPGLFVGAMISSVCFAFGLTTAGMLEQMAVLLVVPLYVCVWYWIAVARYLPDERDKRNRRMALISSVPFWIASLWGSGAYFASLPDRPPECFIVTAAARGHRRWVGPFTKISRRNTLQMANRQLITLWRFEALWRIHGHRSHALFRRVYNRIGPVLARKIISPWVADAVYLALKPAEFAAAGIVRIADSISQPILTGSNL